MEEQPLNQIQKVLLYCLYALIILMVIFSFMAMRNIGQKGYNQCVQQKCDAKGEKFCFKPRELSNCCAGAGGMLAGANNPKPGAPAYTCVFK